MLSMKSPDGRRRYGSMCLLMTAIIWGFAVVAQSSVMKHMPPFLYSGIRMYVGTLSLLIMIRISHVSAGFRRLTGSDGIEMRKSREQKREHIKLLIGSGIACGIVMFFAANLQQVGLLFTSVSKTSFITTLYIVMVPLMGIFLKHRTTRNTWFGVVLATAGLYLLCISESFSIAAGDIIVFAGSVFWGIQILLVDHYVERLTSMEIACTQFFVAGTISLLASPMFDRYFDISAGEIDVIASLPSVLYVGIISTAVAATFQGMGQRYAGPVLSSVILSMESVFGAVFGFIFMGDKLTGREMTGCMMMFIAVLIVQRPTNKGM